MPRRLQQGIAFQPRRRPQPCFRLVLLNVAPETASITARDALAEILRMLQELRRGQVRELAGQPEKHARASAAQFSSLRALIGYGRRFFDLDVHNPPLTRAQRPDYLSNLPSNPGPFPSLRWAENAAPNRGEADVALQLTSAREAGVNCAVVEVWKLIEDRRLPLDIVSSFGGFGRHDGRGWLEFHDGVSNMESSQRLDALQARPDPAWMADGTFMAFLRLAIDLGAWRALERGDQELLVGRDKLSGAALVAVEKDEKGRPVPVAGPAPAGDSTEHLAAWRDPPQTVDPILEASHIHRANQNRASSAAAGAHRMLRQGYDFLDGFEHGRPALGLNFVSFQRDLAALHHVLHLPGWLGDVNFGGPSQPGGAGPTLVRVQAGGLYAVPSRARPFPGARLFEAER